MIIGTKQMLDNRPTMSFTKPVFLTDMCRACMITSDCLQDVVSYELTPNIITMLNSIANLNVSINDPLPSIICISCYKRLQEAYEFRNLCLDSNITLQSYILKQQTEEEMIKSTLRLNKSQQNEFQTHPDSKIKPEDHQNEVIIIENLPDEPPKNEVIDVESVHTAENTEFEIIVIDDPAPSVELNPEPPKKCKEITKRSRGSDIKRKNNIIIIENLQQTLQNYHTHIKAEELRRNEIDPDGIILKKLELEKRNTELIVIQDSPPGAGAQIKSEKKPIEEKKRRRALKENYKRISTGDYNIKSAGMERKRRLEVMNPIGKLNFTKDIPEILSAVGLTKIDTIKDLNSNVELPKNCNSKDEKKKRLKCNQCNHESPDYGALRRHLARHGELPFFCKLCGKCFSRARELKHHNQETHSGCRPYNCAKCNARFKTLIELTAHIRHHSSNSGHFSCELCPRRFASAKHLREHANYSHTQAQSEDKSKDTPKGEFECDQCERSFRKRCDLDRHVRVHSGEKPYVCKICGGRFQQAHNLTKHMVKHTGERSFTCDICNKNFGRSDVLARHMHIHEISKQFSCTQCNRTFVRQSQLNNHLETKHVNPPKDEVE